MLSGIFFLMFIGMIVYANSLNNQLEQERKLSESYREELLKLQSELIEKQ